MVFAVVPVIECENAYKDLKEKSDTKNAKLNPNEWMKLWKDSGKIDEKISIICKDLKQSNASQPINASI